MTAKAQIQGTAFGQRPPPLSIHIRRILERYPDGQIFKELIQNADDAGATVVRFFIDSRHHPTNSLATPALAAYQGPALIAANDAIFTEKDWEGIQKLEDSIKSKDPFKVGKFGIGFNSVYHITDLPTIISGNKIAYLEPQEKIWHGQTGCAYNLREAIGKDTLKPFNGIEGFDESKVDYNKTLFRFPLRHQKSGLSDNVYTVDRLKALIEPLINEAKYLLLFLRSVVTVEVFYLPSGKAKLLFGVNVAQNCRDTITDTRLEFLQQLKKLHKEFKYKISESISSVVKFSIEIVDSKGVRSSSNWLVANQVGTDHKKAIDLAANQCVFPLVGVALQLYEQKNLVKSHSRLFCFLPLPAEVTSPLPVLVHGTFGLSDNRRSIKWPIGEMQNDLAAKWNQMLISNLLPSCYDLLLRNAKELVDPEQFYRAFPCIESTSKDDNWKIVLTPLFILLFQWECFWANRLEEWVGIQDAIFIPPCDPVHKIDIVFSVLTKCGLKLSNVPENIVQALNHYCQSARMMSPALCRHTLYDNLDSYTEESNSDKLDLLQYCLLDLDDRFDDLYGLELLPLADDSFIKFTTSADNIAKCRYFCTEEYPEALLPSLKRRLVNVKPELHYKLLKVAKSQETQLQLLTLESVAQLLPKCYPNEWKDKEIVELLDDETEFTTDWFRLLWKCISPNDLPLFESLLVVPLSSPSSEGITHVTRLKKESDSSVILLSDYSYSKQLLAILIKFGVHFTESIYIKHDQLSKYVNTFDTIGVLNAVSNSTEVISDVKLTMSEALEVQTFSASHIRNLASLQNQKKLLDTLGQLCIFIVLNSQDVPVSLHKAAQISWNSQIVLEPQDFQFSSKSLPENLVILSLRNEQILLDLLKDNIPSLASPELTENFIMDYLVPFIASTSIHDCSKIDLLMEEVFRLFPVLKKKDRVKFRKLANELASLPFLLTEDNSNICMPPQSLYDPSKKELMSVLDNKPVFPINEFATDPNILQCLRECRIQTLISGDMLVTVLTENASDCQPEPFKVNQDIIARMKAVMSYIDDHQQDILREGSCLSRTLTDLSDKKNWIPVLAKPAKHYPSCLVWKGSSYPCHIASPKASNVVLCSDGDDLPLVVGSQMFVCCCPPSISKLFISDVISSAIIQAALDHFQYVVTNMRSFSSPSTLDSLVHKVYSYLSCHLKELKAIFSTNELCTKQLIWIKKSYKFVAPNTMFVKENSSFEHCPHLSPYLQQIPESLGEDYIELFDCFGVRTELTDRDVISVLKMLKEDKGGKVPAKQAWKIVEYILNWLTEGGTMSVLLKFNQSEFSDQILVPTEGSVEEWPCLMPIEKVVYTDLDYLKSFGEEDTVFIHDNFSSLAPLLGVESLSKHLDISDDAFGDVGQHEPLVTRLRNILKDYKGGLTIIKELLQNADDAGATELNICYDARTHHAKSKSLIFPGMADCHGPALLVHNNASFTDEDFENITKLAGATKMNKPLKIGKFGVGFCSVYHITDIPSFISGKWLYIFDPTVSYLKNVITDLSKPGKRISFTERAVSFSSQLLPYENLFGFSQKTDYNQTLFRFPFRSSQSDISTVVYNENHIKALAHEIQKAGSKLLLFLSSVRKITFSRIDNGIKEPSNICVLQKTEISKLSIGIPTLERKDSCVNLVDIDISSVEEVESVKTNELWIVSNNLKNVSDTDKPCNSSIACLINVLKDGSYSVDNSLQGEMFCYLPLSVQTGLPVHVSANFAVLNDRTGIHNSDSENLTEEVQWNVNLMKTVVPNAYLLLLAAIQQLCVTQKISAEKDYDFFSLWPLYEYLKIHNPFDHMVNCFYNLLADSNLFYSSCQSEWLKLSNTAILSNDILKVPPYLESPSKCIVEVCEKLHYPLINLPNTFLSCLPKQIVEECTISEHQFIISFFTNLSLLPVNVRNNVLFMIFKAFALGSKDYVETNLKTNKCVPCSPDGKDLKKCQSIIDPHASFSNLYDEDEGMFPLEDFYQDKVVYTSLQTLGMIRDKLPLLLIIQRAKSILPLYQINQQKAIERSETVIKCLSQYNECNNLIIPDINELRNITFLPVVQKPLSDHYPECICWFGENQTLQCGSNLVKSDSNMYLAGSQVCFLNELEAKSGGCGLVTNISAKRIGIRLQPSNNEIVNHLCHIQTKYSAYMKNDTGGTMKCWVERACEEMYKHMEKSLSHNPQCARDFHMLKSTKSIWTGSEFVAPSSVAKQLELDGPILFCVPHLLKLKENLIKVLEIPEEFSTANLKDCLEQLYEDYKDKAVEGRAIVTAVRACNILGNKPSLKGVFYLPDENCSMAKASDLVYNDAPWCSLDEDFATVHEHIPRRVALKLGVMPIRSKALQQYESQSQDWAGVEFGQHEKLTQRIKNILSQYPGDVTILKELLQNADDAKATKMYIILDKRQHEIKRLPSDNWKDLQGPALLVWNDKGFSDDDFTGIQKLGLGSKRSDTESIGQFGIGFNVVYHLTDCPNFFTNGNTLCVLDPHCRYVPGASTLNPGRRYDRIDEKFWNRLSDLKSTYLVNGESLSNCPQEIYSKGTLFRFPFRHTQELVKKSELVDKTAEESISSTSLFGSSSTPLDANRMQQYLTEWAPKMKEALLFLNSVNEVKFFVIDADVKASMTLTYSYSVECGEDAVDKKTLFLSRVKSFAQQDCQPCVIQYPVCLKEEKPKYQIEKWLIHQGIGDITNPNQIWHYPQVKPKHGIATNLTGSNFIGKVFCFLPLPMKSRLPVHVNGNFILDAARSGLWKSRDASADDKQKWNRKLIQAIASSYTEFLVTCQSEYSTAENRNPNELIEKYYSTFPVWLDTKHNTPEGEMKILAEEVYHKLHKSNSCILVALSSQSNSPIDWLPLHNMQEPSKQVHFWVKRKTRQSLAKTLLNVGMYLTEAPMFLRDHFTEIGISLPIADPTTVYEYYCLYYSEVSETFPNFIEDTKFESIKNFLDFLGYLLIPMQAKEGQLLNITELKTFPEPPYGVPLLLTADEQLCMFSETEKVMCSDYSHIFSVNVRKYFAHPKVCKLKINPEYFINKNDDCFDLINVILDATLPEQLKGTRVINAGVHVSLIVDIWNCLRSDPVFKQHFKSIIEKWALLLTTKNELFMYKCDALLPIIVPKKENSDLSVTLIHKALVERENLKLYNKVFQIIQKHSLMPILDLQVVDLSLCLRLCPRMKHQKRILDNLCFLHENNELQALLSDSVLDDIVGILFSYFCVINFACDKYYLNKMKSLPLFKDISDTYRSLKGKVFIWPDYVCASGKDKWIRSIPNSVIFLPPDGAWSKLAEASVLGIENMSPLVFYVEYIFKSFYLLTDEERQDHLRHIRDTQQLFNTAQYQSRFENADLIQQSESSKFIMNLCQLPCLKKKGQLVCVSIFYDPKVRVFQLFAETDDFPPEAYSDEKWLEFFRKIGLRTQATKDEFISFCESIASGIHKHISEGSKILLDYLFNEQNWYSDEVLLSRVSRIPFVCAKDLQDLASIASVAIVENTIQQGSKTFRLTSLCKAAAGPTAYLIWTIKPVVELPKGPHFPLKTVQDFLMILEVCMKPSCQDVIRHIVNLTKSQFAHFEWFDVYPETLTQKKGKEHLLYKIMCNCYSYLNKNNCDSEALESLKDIPCIPVSRTGDKDDRSSPVLVEPLQVIASNSKDVAKLVPFLNPLLTDLYSVLDVLSTIGVHADVELENIQYALKFVHDNIEPPITVDPNTLEVVKQLIKAMYFCLKDNGKVSGQLYLPNKAGMLVESTKLLYNDVERFKGANLNLSKSTYSFLSLLSDKLKELNEYGFRSSDFYNILPESVQPLPLSVNYKEELSDQCKVKETLSDFASMIRKALEFPGFVEVAKLLMTAFSPKKKYSEKFIENLGIFHFSVKVLAVDDLHVNVYLTLVNPFQYIGRVKVDFLLQKGAGNEISLFIDQSVYALKLNLFESLTSAIVSHIIGMDCSDMAISIPEAEKALSILLKAPTPNQIEELLNDQGINTAEIEISSTATSKFTPKLGSPIPEEWHHRLFCDIFNVFRPQEWVGYEHSENHFVFARVEHSVIDSVNDEEKNHNPDERLKQFKITTSEDEEGVQKNVTVTVLDLYKILRIKSSPNDDGVSDIVLYDSDSESVQLWNTIKDDKLKSILKEICQELKRIWKLLDKDQRRKALKAMYLKWHPDKNPHPLATKAFQFLQHQIHRLEQGQQLEEPDEASDESQCSFSPDSYWDNYFRNWDNIARSQSRYWRREQTYYHDWSENSPSSSYTSSTFSYNSRYYSFDHVMDDVRVTSDPNTAKVWLKQAQNDLKALNILLREINTYGEVCAHVCFMAHQVAEKALKAGMYQLSGLHSSALKNHQLVGHATAIMQMRVVGTSGLSQCASELESYYLNPRYPNRYSPAKVPSDQYTPSQANEASKAAEKIVTVIKNFV